MQDAWHLLLRRLELEPPIFHADEFRGELGNWREHKDSLPDTPQEEDDAEVEDALADA